MFDHIHIKSQKHYTKYILFIKKQEVKKIYLLN